MPVGLYYVQVCPFSNVLADFTAPYTYHGVIAINTAAGTQALATRPSGRRSSRIRRPTTRRTTPGPVLAQLARQPHERRLRLPATRSRTPRRAALGLQLPDAPADVHVGRQQRVRGIGVGRRLGRRPAARQLRRGRSRRAAASRRPQLLGSMVEHLVHEQVRPDPAAPGGNDIDRRPSRTCSSPTTGCTTTRYYLGFTEANYNLQLDNLGRNAGPTAARTTRRSATPRPARSPAARRRTSAATTPTRSRCRTASPASPTSTSSSRSPARSTPRAPTAAST